MSKKDENISLRIVIAIFEEDDAAKAALKLMEKDESLGMQQGAVVHQNKKGKVKVHELGDKGGGEGAVIGGAIGGAIGLIAGPAALVTGAIGAGIGGLLTKFSDGGIPNHKLDEVGEALQPGMSAVVAIVTLEAYADAKETMTDVGAFALTEVPDIAVIKRVILAAQAADSASEEE